MKKYLYSTHFDLITPDGKIVKELFRDEGGLEVEFLIENISSTFIGFDLGEERVIFNFKSSLAQLGLNAQCTSCHLDRKDGRAYGTLRIEALGALAREMLPHIGVDTQIGKLFAPDDRRLVINLSYLQRMFGRYDRYGDPLLRFGNSQELHLEKREGHTVAFIELKQGVIVYKPSIKGFLATLGEALKRGVAIRDLLKLHQTLDPLGKREVVKGEILLVATPPLHMRTVFGRVVDKLLPAGVHHTSANILQPEKMASGDVYELFGESQEEVTQIPLEFYTLEPHREYISFADQTTFKKDLELKETIFNVFKTAEDESFEKKALLLVKQRELSRLKREDWVTRNPIPLALERGVDGKEMQQLVQHYIEEQPCYPYLLGMESGAITSEGVLFSRYFPSPLLKSMLLSFYVRSKLKRLYFNYPSRSEGYYFSQEDRKLLEDLYSFGIPVYWADETSGSLLRYLERKESGSGMFVPTHHLETFKRATFFGVYGSNLIASDFEHILREFLKGILEMRPEMHHPKLNTETPLALVTGGGPGAMEVGNKMAKELEILSCAHVVDFRSRLKEIMHEQKQNPYVEAKMTYRLHHLIERQAEFLLDFPIFVMGGIGTDFEFALEELRLKVSLEPFPVLLFGPISYWREKITHRFRLNLTSGTIKGSEWVSNCLFCIQNAEQALKIFREYFQGTLPIGREFPYADEGFVITS